MSNNFMQSRKMSPLVLVAPKDEINQLIDEITDNDTVIDETILNLIVAIGTTTKTYQSLIERTQLQFAAVECATTSAALPYVMSIGLCLGLGAIGMAKDAEYELKEKLLDVVRHMNNDKTAVIVLKEELIYDTLAEYFADEPTRRVVRDYLYFKECDDGEVLDVINDIAESFGDIDIHSAELDEYFDNYYYDR